jgi:hypothetical protein
MRGVIYPDDEPWVVTDIGYAIGVVCPLKQEVLIWLHIPFRVCNAEVLWDLDRYRCQQKDKNRRAQRYDRFRVYLLRRLVVVSAYRSGHTEDRTSVVCDVAPATLFFATLNKTGEWWVCCFFIGNSTNKVICNKRAGLGITATPLAIIRLSKLPCSALDIYEG